MQKASAHNDKAMGALKDENSRLKAQKDTLTKEIMKLKKDYAETQVKLGDISFTVLYKKRFKRKHLYIFQRFHCSLCFKNSF